MQTPCQVQDEQDATKPSAAVEEPLGLNFTRITELVLAMNTCIRQARESLDELHGDIEEFKDPVQLARVADVFTATTPQTPGAQFEFIQARITKIGVCMNLVQAAVDNWLDGPVCKRHVREHKKIMREAKKMVRKNEEQAEKKIRREEEKKKTKKARKTGTRWCDECGEWAHEESSLQSTPQWAVCTQCSSRPTPLRCDFCDKEEDATHRMLRASKSSLCFRCACVPPPPAAPVVNDDQK
jgi:Sec-independent protein translocase protein TatA